MLEKLQALARIVIVPAVALYLCGFVCITGYYAQFGIVTFDIVNARFLVAGIYAIWPLAVSLWLAWRIYNRYADANIASPKQALRRYAIYCELILFPFFLATTMKALYQSASITRISGPAEFKFQNWFGRWDIPGDLLSWLHVGQDPIQVILGIFTYILFYCGGLCLLLVALFSLKRLAKSKSAERTILAGTTIDQPPATTTEPSPYFADELGVWIGTSYGKRIGILAIDFLFLSLLASLSIFSWWETRAAIFGTEAIHQELDFSMQFAWCFVTIAGFLVFSLIGLSVRTEHKKFSFEYMLDPYLITDVLQWTVFPILFSIFLFGATIFPRIPFAIGGGQPRQVTIISNEIVSRALGTDVYIIGETADYLLAVPINKTAAFEIRKDTVEAIQTLRTSPTTQAPSSLLDRKQIGLKSEPNRRQTATSQSTPSSARQAARTPRRSPPR